MNDYTLSSALLLVGALSLTACRAAGPARQEDPAVRLEATFAS